MGRDAVDMLTFEALMNQVRRGGTGINRSLYSLFPQTAGAGLSGIPAGTQPVSKALLNRGAMNVARMGSRRIPVLAGVLQGLGGDPIGGIGTAGGGIVGGMLGAPLGPLGVAGGAWLGSTIGSGLTKGAANLAGGVVGIDPNDPLSGPDWNLGPFALTPYAKTKKRTKRGIELAKLQLPLYNEIADKALNRQLQRDQLAQVGSLITNVYSNNPYMR